MRRHRTINLVVLATFLPMAGGCSSMRTLPVRNDPLDERTWMSFEEPVDIVSYTDSSGVLHGWVGTVRAVTPDSLELRRELLEPQPGGNAPPQEILVTVETMRLAKADVAEVHRRVISGVKTAFAVLGVGVLILGAAFVYALSTFELDFGGGRQSAGGY